MLLMKLPTGLQPWRQKAQQQQSEAVREAVTVSSVYIREITQRLYSSQPQTAAQLHKNHTTDNMETLRQEEKSLLTEGFILLFLTYKLNSH